MTGCGRAPRARVVAPGNGAYLVAPGVVPAREWTYASETTFWEPA